MYVSGLLERRPSDILYDYEFHSKVRRKEGGDVDER